MFLKPPTPGQCPGKTVKRARPQDKQSNEEDDREDPKSAKTKYDQEKRIRLFQPKWLTTFPWLSYDGAVMFCSVCREFPDNANKESSFFTGTSSFRYDGLPSHEKSKFHQTCELASKAKTSTQPAPVLEGLHKMEVNFEEKMVKLFNIVYYLAKKERPFSDYPDLISLFNKMGNEMSTSYLSDKACARFLADIYEVEREPLLKQIKDASCFSVMIDGATDSATLEMELVYLRLLMDGRPKNIFLSIEDIKQADASGILDTIDEAFKHYGVEREEWEKKLVGFGSDGASVNVGVRSGVATRLKNKIPHLVAIHCIAHRLELGVLDAIKQDTLLQKLQECLQMLYREYHYSPKALRELRMIADMLDEKVLKPVNLGGTRWLPYVHRAIKVLCDSYKVIIAHFEDMVSPERKPKPSASVVGRAHQLLKVLKTYRSFLFTFFLCDTLDHLAILSSSFQRDSLTASEAVESLESTFLHLEQMKHSMGPRMKVAFQSSLDGTYKGVKLSDYRSTILKDERINVIDKIVHHLEERLFEMQRDSIVSKFAILDPTTYPEGRKDLAVYGMAELQELMHHFEGFLEERSISKDSIVAQYSDYKVFASRRSSTPLRDLLPTIVTQFRDRFSSLAVLIDVYLVLPCSTAVCERGFSTMKRIKNDWRSSLGSDQLRILMFLSIEGPDHAVFDAQRAVQHWWRSGKRSRRPGFNPWEGRAETCDDEM